MDMSALIFRIGTPRPKQREHFYPKGESFYCIFCIFGFNPRSKEGTRNERDMIIDKRLGFTSQGKRTRRHAYVFKAHRKTKSRS